MARVCRANLGDLRRKACLLEDQKAELEKTVAHLQRENHRLCVTEVTHRERLAQVQVQLVEAQQVEEALETEDRSNRRQMQEMRAEVEELREALQGQGSRTKGPWEELRSADEERSQRNACRRLVREPCCETNNERSDAEVQQQYPGGAESLVAEVIPTEYEEVVAWPQREVHSQPEGPVMDGDVATMDIRFEKREYPQNTPKMNLLEWSREEELEQPFYKTVQRPQDGAFQSTVMVAGKRYGSTMWEKNKKSAEQAAAIVCLRMLGVPEGKSSEEHLGPEVNGGREVLRKRGEDMERTVQKVIKAWECKRHPPARFVQNEVRCRDC